MTGERETEGEGAERGRRVNKDFLFTSLSAVEGPRTRTKTERKRERGIVSAKSSNDLRGTVTTLTGNCFARADSGTLRYKWAEAANPLV